MRTRTTIKMLALVTMAFAMIGCGGYTALEPGNSAPELAVAGWTNGDAPDYAGKVLVIDAFATW